MGTPPYWALVAATAAALLLARSARGNGQFPNAGLIVVDPKDPAHVVLRTTFGVVSTRNAGKDWYWTCETAAGYADIDPPLALTAKGTLFAGLDKGVSVAHADGCRWAKAKGALANLPVPDVSVRLGPPPAALAITFDSVSKTCRYWESLDDADDWIAVGAPLPWGFECTTLDAAPSDPDRIYLSGVQNTVPPKGMLARSIDHGASWTLFEIPGSGGATPPYLGAIDPKNPERVYVRLGGTPGILMVTNNGGEAWTEAFKASGILRGFALSPAGDEVAAGTSSEGIWTARTDALTFAKISPRNVRCLRWSDQGLYACANQQVAGFFVAISHDRGKNFEPLLDMSCIRGPLACPADSTVGGQCPQAWPAIAATIQAQTCASAVTSAATTSGGEPLSPGPQGCACALPAQGVDRLAAWWLAALGIAALYRRRR